MFNERRAHAVPPWDLPTALPALCPLLLPPLPHPSRHLHPPRPEPTSTPPTPRRAAAPPSTCPLHSPLSRRVGLRSLVEDLFLQYAYPCPLLLVRVSLVILVRAVRLHLLISYGAIGLSNPRSLPRQALVVYDVLATKNEPRDLSLRRLLHIRHRLPLGEQVFDGGDRARVPADRHTNFP